MPTSTPLVLVADDEPSMLELVARHLRTMNEPKLEVIQASDGEEAWRLAREHLPDLVSLIRENDLRGNDSGEEWTRIWTSWGERDPQAAMDFFKTYDWTGWNDAARGEAKTGRSPTGRRRIPRPHGSLWKPTRTS